MCTGHSKFKCTESVSALALRSLDHFGSHIMLKPPTELGEGVYTFLKTDFPLRTSEMTWSTGKMILFITLAKCFVLEQRRSGAIRRSEIVSDEVFPFVVYEFSPSDSTSLVITGDMMGLQEDVST